MITRVLTQMTQMKQIKEDQKSHLTVEEPFADY